jgi:hypothetical protein
MYPAETKEKQYQINKKGMYRVHTGTYRVQNRQYVPASGILYTWYKAVHDGMYWYVPVRTLLGTWRYEKPQNGTYQYVPT